MDQNDFFDFLLQDNQPIPTQGNTFRFNAKWCFLTYASCAIDQNELLQHFVTTENTLSFARVALESHQDGTPHLHVLLGFLRKRDIRNVKHFDHEGYHPNIQPVRCVKNVLEYISKDGRYVDYGVVPGTEGIWSRICNATDELSFWNLAEELDPKSFVINHEKLEYFCQKRFRSNKIEYQ